MWQLGLLLICAYIGLTKVLQSIRSAQARTRLIAEHGCQPPRRVSSVERIFDSEVDRYKKLQEHTYLDYTNARYAKYGKTFRTTMFDATLFNTIEPDNIKSVLSTNFSDYTIGERRKSAFKPFLGDGVFNSDKEKWSHARQMLRPSFKSGQVRDTPVLEGHIHNLFNRIGSKGVTLDLQELFFQMTMDTATELLFGRSCGLLTLPTDKSSAVGFANAFGNVQKTLIIHQSLGKLSALLPKNEFKTDLTYLHKFVEEEVAEYKRLAAGGKDYLKEGKYVFLQELLKQTEDPDVLSGQLMSVLVGGRDTTASLLSNLFFVLARQPEVYKKLQEEVDALEGRLPTSEELTGMQYLKFCIKESLRFHPPVPMNSRQALADTWLPLGGGPDGESPVLVPKGAIVGWHCWAMHRREDIFGAEPEKFIPERWEEIRPGWGFLPFNGGPRTCLGQQFALTEVSYTTVRLMQQYRNLEPRDPAPWRESLTLTCTNMDGTKVSMY